MDKRTLILGSGALATAMVPLAVKAEETRDWRDELMEKQYRWTVHYKYVSVMKEDGGLKTSSYSKIHIERDGHYEGSDWKVDNSYTVQHVIFFTNFDETVRDHKSTIEKLEGHNTKFMTLKDAYTYAKELKQKHYG